MADSGTSGQERVLCWACERVWSRRDGLRCICGSEATEVFEEGHNPRAQEEAELDDEPNPQMPGHQPYGHHPWTGPPPDPPEEDIDQIRIRRNGPTSFSLQGNFVRNVSSNQIGRNRGTGSPVSPQQGLSNHLMGALQEILTTHGPAFGQTGDRQYRQPGQPQSPGGVERPRSADYLNPRNEMGPGMFDHHHGTGHRLGGGPQMHVFHNGPNHRFHYSSTARIFPRDATHAEAHVGPPDSMSTIFQHVFGPGLQPAGQRLGQTHQHEQHEQQQREISLANNPLLALIGQLFGPQGHLGDYALTQEDLDRIISQLPPGTGGAGAPGPAPADAIAALPRKKATQEMMGTDGTAECTICLDQVELGQEVTTLPCNHWFHGACVGAWLAEHNTCPHCRKSITDPPGDPADAPASSSSAPNRTSSAPPTPTILTPDREPYSMPGAWHDANGPVTQHVLGNGSRGDPYRVDERPSHSRQSSYNRRRAPSAHSSHNEGSGQNEGFGSRLRRSLFGGSQRHSGSG